jgi:hypothetical protein
MRVQTRARLERLDIATRPTPGRRLSGGGVIRLGVIGDAAIEPLTGGGCPPPYLQVWRILIKMADEFFSSL